MRSNYEKVQNLKYFSEMEYSFKHIKRIPTSLDIYNTALSRSPEQNCSLIHHLSKIQRFRQLFKNKTKLKLWKEAIIQIFHGILFNIPQFDEIHPFYADLINLACDREHYKTALFEIIYARTSAEKIIKEYLKRAKHSDSFSRRSYFKRQILLRMKNGTKKIEPSLSFLENIRKYLIKLPDIDPCGKTLLLIGFPNVGKSSFMNRITKAEVEVHPYPFTTKSLFVGHISFQNVRWQVIDTPGLLDGPLEDKSVMELQSITALAHLKASILFFIDISEQCGYSIKAQVSLFKNIQPLFMNKKIVIVFTKVDIRRFEDLSQEDKTILLKLQKEEKIQSIELNNLTGEGIQKIYELAMENVIKAPKDISDMASKLCLSMPTKN